MLFLTRALLLTQFISPDGLLSLQDDVVGGWRIGAPVAVEAAVGETAVVLRVTPDDAVTRSKASSRKLTAFYAPVDASRRLFVLKEAGLERNEEDSRLFERVYDWVIRTPPHVPPPRGWRRRPIGQPDVPGCSWSGCEENERFWPNPLLLTDVPQAERTHLEAALPCSLPRHSSALSWAAEVALESFRILANRDAVAEPPILAIHDMYFSHSRTSFTVIVPMTTSSREQYRVRLDPCTHRLISIE